MTAFQDHFSPVSDDYRRHRPGYPSELFHWLAQQAPHTRLAWDCATGTGQAARELARHFEQVAATDASENQIRAARPVPGVRFSVASADSSGLPDRSVALVTVAQALHWFNLEAFYAEVRQVSSPGGLLAVWSYGRLITGDPVIDGLLHDFHDVDLAPFWPAERRHVITGYRDLAFPFETLDTPAFAMQTRWNLEQLMGYLGTWSAVARCAAATGTSPLDALRALLRTPWGDPDAVRTVTWPLALKVGRTAGSGPHA